jgi:hemerythrin-like domain-containing protein
MQAGPAKVNELFAKLSETSDGALKTREKVFAELKAELELHTGLEEQHLFPILRRNPETKGLVAEAIKDNKELRTKLAELDALPKNDEAFIGQLKELQKAFRQHARDEKRELLPAVQRALSEEQVQGVAEKIEAGVAEAEQARQDEVDDRRLKARQEREQADRQAQAEQPHHAAAEKSGHPEAGHKDVMARDEHLTHDAAEAVTRSAAVTQANVFHIAKDAARTTQRVGEEIQGIAASGVDAAKTLVPDPETLATLPKVAVGAMTGIGSAWFDWVGQTTCAGTQISQQILWQAVEQQQRFAANAMQGWMRGNENVMRITMQMAQEGLRPFANRTGGSDDRGSTRR